MLIKWIVVFLIVWTYIQTIMAPKKKTCWVLKISYLVNTLTRETELLFWKNQSTLMDFFYIEFPVNEKFSEKPEAKNTAAIDYPNYWT